MDWMARREAGSKPAEEVCWAQAFAMLREEVAFEPFGWSNHLGCKSFGKAFAGSRRICFGCKTAAGPSFGCLGSHGCCRSFPDTNSIDDILLDSTATMVYAIIDINSEHIHLAARILILSELASQDFVRGRMELQPSNWKAKQLQIHLERKL